MDELMTMGMVVLDAKARTKNEAIRMLAERMEKEGRLKDLESYIAAVQAREEAFSTAMGFDVAIPHGKSAAVKTASLAFARLEETVEWSVGDTAKFIFMIAVPSKAAGDDHLKILAALSRQLIHEEFREGLTQIGQPQELVAMIENL